MKAGGYKKLTGAEQRALAEQLAQAKVDPAVEAIGKEQSFLKSLGTAQDDFEWIMSNEAWTILGHSTFAGWWETTVQPIMRNLPFRPTREVAGVVLDRVRAEEAELPPKQRRSQKELALLAGVSPKTVQRRSQDPSQRTMSSTGDLGKPAVVDALSQAISDAAERTVNVGPGVVVPIVPGAGLACEPPVDHEHCAVCGKDIPSVDQQGGYLRCRKCDPRQEHIAEATLDGKWAECRLCTSSASAAEANTGRTAGEPASADKAAVLAGIESTGGGTDGRGLTDDAGTAAPVPDEDSPAAELIEPSHAGVPAAGVQIEERIEEEAVEPPVDTPAAGTALPGDDASLPLASEPQQPGQDSPTGPGVEGLPSRSETYLHLPHGGVGGEAPGEPRPPVEPVELEGGGILPPSSSSEHEDTPGDQLLAAFAALVAHLGQADAAGIGPTLFDNEMSLLHEHVEDITDFMERLEGARDTQ